MFQLRMLRGKALVYRQGAALPVAEMDEQEACRRIMAEPDLLAACEAAADQVGQHADGCRWWDIPVNELSGSPQSLARQAAACTCYLEQCRRAIARAKGQ